MPIVRSFILLAALVSCAAFSANATDRWGRPREAFVNWENPHVHPLDLTPDGTRLLAVNTPDNSLLVFNITSGKPVLESSIFVGLDPVSVRARSNTEAWVVNRISDNVSVVNISTRVVTAVLAADDEPADVIFAGSPQRAFVSCAKQSLIDIFNPADLTVARQSVFVNGKEPRALAVSADGTKVFAAFFESGNGTTEVTGGKDNGFEVDLVRRPEGPYGGVDVPPNRGTQFVPPLNPANPPPPPVSMIVRKNTAGRWMDDNNGDWTRFVSGDLSTLGGANGGRVAGWDLPDRDVAVIDTASLGVTYQARLMNSLMAIAVRPGTGEVTVVGTDATNEIRWEPNLQGTFTRVNLARFQAGGTSTISDLNPHLDYTVRNLPAASRAPSIGDPRGIAWNADGSRAFITGMGSNNLVVIDGNGARVGRVDIGEGPTGVVFQASSAHVFVLNKFEASISVIDATALTEMARVPFFDPTPAAIKTGRKHLYNTHTGSGLGQISCASCHIDGRTDRLAWNLGNPAGTLTPMTGIDDTSGALVTVQQHPMKGPLLTQTLQDVMNNPDFHWSGDRPDLAHFASAFVTLQGADAPLSTASTGEFEDFLDSIHTPPNPNRNLDNTYRTALSIVGPNNAVIRTGNAVSGAQEFEANCRRCHPGQTARGDLIRQGGAFGVQLNRRPPTWRNFHERTGLWFKSATGSTCGFGFQQDGSFDSTHNQSRDDNMMAFMYSVNGSFPYQPTGLNETNRARDTHAAVGRQLLFSSSTTTSADTDLQSFLLLAEHAEVGLVAKAQVSGVPRGFAYLGDGVFQSDRRGEWWTLAQVRALAGVIFTVVPAGSEIRIGIDRDLDGIYDGDDGSPAAPATLVRSSVNVAPRGAATQSSDYSTAFPAANAIDQSTTSFSHTATTDTTPSWNLTLNDTYAIDRLVLVNRTGFESRLRDITVYFLDGAGSPIFRSHFLNRNNRLLGPAQLTLDLPTTIGAAIHAKGLRIVRTSDPFGRGQQLPNNAQDEQNVLTLAEVQVFGATSSDDNFIVSATPRPLPGGTFEDIDMTGTYIYNPQGLPWTYTSGSGIAGNASGFTSANPNAPQGTQVLFLQNAGFTQQTLRLVGGSYRLSFSAAERGSNNSTPQTAVVSVDGREVGRFTPTDKNYASFQTTSFVLAAGAHTIRLAGLGQNTNGTAATDTTVLVDNVCLASANTPPKITAIATQTSTRGTTASLQVAATDPNGLALKYSASGLPKGLAIDPASGRVSGTVALDAASSNAVTIAADDGVLTATVGFQWTIADQLLSTFADDFGAATIDTSKWTVGSLYAPDFGGAVDPGIGVVVKNGQLAITPRSNVATDSYRGVYSNGVVDLRGASVSVQVTPAGGNADTYLALVAGTNALVMNREGPQLWLEQVINGSYDYTIVNYSSASPYWRIRHDATSDLLLFQTSVDGLAWTTVRSATRKIDLSAMHVELTAGTYEAEAAPGVATFDNLLYRKGLGFADTDIGTPNPAGSSSFANGVYTVNGGGLSIATTGDQLHFTWQQWSGDGDWIARVASQTATDPLGRAGIVFRETLQPTARFAALFLTPGKGFLLETRSAVGAATQTTFVASNAAPNNWLRLTRTGNTFTAYRSIDGATWTAMGSASIPMAVTLDVGFAVTSHVSGTAATATIDSVKATPPQ